MRKKVLKSAEAIWPFSCYPLVFFSLNASVDKFLSRGKPSVESALGLSQSRFWGRGCDEALFSEKRGFSVKRGGEQSVNGGFGKDFFRKGNSVKRSGPFGEPPDSEK